MNVCSRLESLRVDAVDRNKAMKEQQEKTNLRGKRGLLSSSISSIGDRAAQFLNQPREGSTINENEADNDDDSAEMLVNKHLSSEESQNKKIQLVPTLAERAATIESIKWLGRHIPRCTLRQISEHVNKESIEGTTMSLPHVSYYQAALLFIDMSGFTKLSQQLNVESLSQVSNIYNFTMVVSKLV